MWVASKSYTIGIWAMMASDLQKRHMALGDFGDLHKRPWVGQGGFRDLFRSHIVHGGFKDLHKRHIFQGGSRMASDLRKRQVGQSGFRLTQAAGGPGWLQTYTRGRWARVALAPEGCAACHGCFPGSSGI